MREYTPMTCARQPPDGNSYPVWFDGKTIHEVLICEEILRDYPMLCVHDTFFTTEGRVTDETFLKREILERIKHYVTSRVAKRTVNLLDALRVVCSSPPLPLCQDRIHAANGTLQSLHDRSVGFFRRQIILTAKERPEGRVDDPFIAEKMCAEAEGIFLWALEGLRRLIDNNYQFTISERARENMEAAVADGNNIVAFMQSIGYINFEPNAAARSKNLYAAYRLWCEDNAYNSLSMKSFCVYLSQNTATYHITATNNIHIGGGQRSRGFLGLRVLAR